MVRLRRRASDEALRWPEGANQIIARIAADEAETLKLSDVSVAKRFLAVVDKAPLSDVLYPDALAAIDRHYRMQTRMLSNKPSADDIAALTTK